MERTGGVWVLGEERNGAIHPVSYELLAWGRGLADKLSEPLTCAILGGNVRVQATELIHYGADRVLVANDPLLGTFLPDPYVRILSKVVRRHRPDVLLAAATTMGRTLMPILAAELHTGLTADCTELDIDREERLLLQTRPAIGGNVMATIKTPNHRPQMATVRPRSRRPLPEDSTRKGEIVEHDVDPADLASRITQVMFESDPITEESIQDADAVIAGGKGFQNADKFSQVFEIAEVLGGAVGASRPVVDQGWVTYAHQVGLSGKSVTPKLYMALGISGSANHLAGMASSERIIAINKDPDASIFKVADFGIVGDLAEVVPILIAQLREVCDKNHQGVSDA